MYRRRKFSIYNFFFKRYNASYTFSLGGCIFGRDVENTKTTFTAKVVSNSTIKLDSPIPERWMRVNGLAKLLFDPTRVFTFALAHRFPFPTCRRK